MQYLWLVVFVLCTAWAAGAEERLVVGSKRFTESYILGELVRQTAERAGEAQVTHRQGLGNTGILFAALTSGEIDLYPEYTGTIDKEVLKNRTPADLMTLQKQLAPLGLGVGVPLGFNDTYALAMGADQAEKLGIRTLSDLKRHPELRYGLSQEFLNRADGWPGVRRVYGLAAQPRALEHGLAYEAIAAGQIDLIDIYSTDAKIDRYRLRVLTDDKRFFPAYDAVLLYRLDLPKRLPKTWAAIGQLEGKLDEKQMVQLNADAELRGLTFAEIAGRFLRGETDQATTRSGFIDQLFGADFGRLTFEHLLLVFASLLVGVAVGVPLGIWAAAKPALSQVILSGVGIIQTIPSLALLAFLIPVLQQIGTVPALVALFLYSLLPIVRNTYTGLMDIPPGLRESGLALGLPAGARLRLIELPLASRTILAGIKTAAVINVGTATIAAFIGAGGFGERIATGLALNDNATLLAGAIPAAGLALLVQFAFDLLERWVVPSGLRS
ncbi:glycine betaine ABC transporter substrate-binding protein [Gloeobacter violaceus]|uniref:Glr0890 protein n=1 Tax=Gloeobacter violaceus (strain ATCC 29082 / PCC 7421) TaxID=251221 RepID=Q7NM78_GLOVI|nr:glycine betaine ABC transporter substrate-binding protein [Gloeobacter violaceus]BAC88831.1 glr0890 [Gloeobacter violaceus PCC 7421]